MKKCIYSVTLFEKEFSIYEVKRKKKVSYVMQRSERLVGTGNIVKITAFVYESCDGAIRRLRLEISSFVEEHAHLVIDHLPI